MKILVTGELDILALIHVLNYLIMDMMLLFMIIFQIHAKNHLKELKKLPEKL